MRPEQLADWFQVLIAVALGLAIILGCRVAFRRPDLAIEQWRELHSFLKTSPSPLFVRTTAAFGVFTGALMLVVPVEVVLENQRGLPVLLRDAVAAAAVSVGVLWRRT